MLDRFAGDTPSAKIAVDSAVLVSLDFSDKAYAENLEELRQLAASDQLAISAIVKGKRSRPDPATFVGSGKVDEITACIGTNWRIAGDFQS